MDIPIDQLEPGPIRHRTLPEDFIRRVKAMKAILAEVDQSPLAEILDDFKRDAHPERELVIWEHIASTYELFVSHEGIVALPTKKEILSVLLGVSMDQEKFPEMKYLRPEQVRDLTRSYKGL
jgi:hypothetical protein